MQILFATGIYPPDIGGPAFYTERLARRFKNLGHHAEILTYGEGGDDQNKKIFRVSRLYPLVIRHIIYAYRILRLARRADLIYAQDSWSAGGPVILANLFLRLPVVLKVVGDYGWEQAQGRFGVTDTLDQFQDKKYGLAITMMKAISHFIARRADLIITPSNYLKNIALRWGVKDFRIKVIYNAVEPIVATGPELHLRPRTILSVGRLVPWKGFEELIYVMREVRDEIKGVQLVIVGDGPERQKLEGLVTEFGLESVVHLPGGVAHDELSELYGTAAAFVLNTSYEGFSHQLIEVMGAGLPVATTESGGNAEIVRGGENALVFAPNDLPAIKNSIIKLLTDSEFAKKICLQAKEDVKKFNEEQMIKETLDVFQRLSGKSGTAIVNISLDETILHADSSSYRRMLAYAEGISAFTSVILSSGKAVRFKKLGNNLFGVRFGGGSKATAFIRTLWKIKSLKLSPLKPTVISAQDPFFAGLVAWRLANICKARLIIELHGDFWPEDKKLWPGFVRNFIAKGVLRRTDIIRIVSNKVKEDLFKFDKKLTGKQIEVFPIISEEINPWPFPNKVRGGIAGVYHEDAITALFVGRLIKEKGLDWFLPVFALTTKQRPLHLRIVGDGEEREALKQLSKGLDIDSQIDFVGSVPEALLDNEYRTADFLVLPSRQESWGRVVVEAMQSGCPVIATKEVGAAHDILKNGDNALVVPFGDDEAMKQALIKMASSQDLRAKLGEAGKATVAGLSFGKTADKMRDLWKNIGNQ